MNFPQLLQQCPNQHWGNQKQCLRAVGQSFYLGDSETYGNKVCKSMSLNRSWGITAEGSRLLFPECTMILEPGGTWFLRRCCQFLAHQGQVSVGTRCFLLQTVSSAVPGQQRVENQTQASSSWCPPLADFDSDCLTPQFHLPHHR